MAVTACYVHAGGISSRYFDMVMVSALSAARWMPTAPRWLICDRQTAVAPGFEELASQAFDNVVVVDSEFQDSSVRSRHLKVILRRLVDGPLLFLDSDVLVVRKLPDSSLAGEEFSAVPDDNGLEPAGTFPEWAKTLYRQLAWQIPHRPYVNSGVTFWPESNTARSLGERWEREWRRQLGAGESRDQPALNHALAETGTVPRYWPAEMNTLVLAVPHLIRRAGILHFNAGHPHVRHRTQLDDLCLQWARDHQVNWSGLDRAVAANSAWVDADRRSVMRTMAGVRLSAAWRALARGDRGTARWLARQAIRLSPTTAAGWRMLARASVARITVS